MGSLDPDFLFTDIPFEENIDISRNIPFENTERVKGLSKEKLKELLSITTKESYFIFSRKLQKKVDGVAIGSAIGPTLETTFLAYFENSWLQSLYLILNLITNGVF